MEKINRKLSIIKKRIFEYIDYKGIKKGDFFREIRISNTNFHGINAKSELGGDKILEIIRYYPDLNPEWLLTGKGSMLRPVEAMEEAPQTLEEPRSGYGKAREVNPAICSACEERERIIASKDKEIASLERQIEGLKAGFENQIEDLKSNLERLIASKDEMLAMKEEAIKSKEATLAAKDEIIRIQSRRISELEDKESEDLKKLGSVGKIGEENTTLPNIQPEALSSKAKKEAYQP